MCAGWTPGEEVDLTWLLTNPDFSEGSKGWEGTSFTAASSGVAEFYDKTYDTYQVLERMPAGTYRLRAQGFYRYGDKAEAYNAHRDGSEQLLAGLYLNNSRQMFMSLFDGSAPYTYNPYTYPDDVWTANDAFNRDGEYRANEVEYELLAKGDLRVGLDKTEYRYHDWNCFDNFKLLYVAKPTAIREVTGSAAVPVDVVHRERRESAQCGHAA